MLGVGFYLMLAVMAGLMIAAIRVERPVLGAALKRYMEQFAVLVPRMFCALVAAGFCAKLLPAEWISGLLGRGSGLLGLTVAFIAGLLVPAGPVICFSIAAIFAKAGATPAAVITFITSWSLFGAHRLFIYELPLLGFAFAKMRMVSVLPLPLLAGLGAALAGLAVTVSMLGRY
jgi:hypothetical protein